MEELKLKSEKYLSLDINAKRKLAVKAAELRDLWEEEKRSKKPVYNLKLNRYVRPTIYIYYENTKSLKT